MVLLACLATTALAQGRSGRRPARGAEQEKNKEPEGPTIVALGERAPELYAAGWANYDGTPTLEKFKDRIVVLFFFRTDDNSADSIATVSDAYKALRQSGVVVVGLTPQKKELAESAVKGKEIKFIVGYGVNTEERYQVSAFPKVYLLDTSGRLVDRFHPGDNLEEKIRAQMRKTPPSGADAESLRDRLDRAKAAAKGKEYGKAYSLALNVSKLADAGSATGKAAGELVKQLEEAAKKWLDEAKAAAKAEDLDRACEILSELSVRFAGTAVGGDADNERGRLMGDGKIKPKLMKALEDAKGRQLNDEAAEQETAKRYLEALKLYNTVLDEYPETAAAKTAEQAIARINTDPKVQSTIKKLVATAEAERWLDLGDRFAKAEIFDRAREFYQRVVDSHPETEAAAQAKGKLAKLPEDKPEEVTPRPEPDEGDQSSSE